MSNQTTQSLPAIDCIQSDGNGKFYLSASQCGTCNAIYINERSVCAKCFTINNMEIIKLQNSGKLYSYSIVHRSFPGVEVPYISAIVDLEGGGTIKGNLIGVNPSPENNTFDMTVNVVFKDALGRKDKDGNSYVSYFFEPA